MDFKENKLTKRVDAGNNTAAECKKKKRDVSSQKRACLPAVSLKRPKKTPEALL